MSIMMAADNDSESEKVITVECECTDIIMYWSHLSFDLRQLPHSTPFVLCASNSARNNDAWAWNHCEFGHIKIIGCKKRNEFPFPNTSARINSSILEFCSYFLHSFLCYQYTNFGDGWCILFWNLSTSWLVMKQGIKSSLCSTLKIPTVDIDNCNMKALAVPAKETIIILTKGV